MQNNPDTLREAMRLANSPEGQQLLNLLKKSGPDQLQKAMDSAASGNYQQARQALSGLLESADVQALLTKLGGSHGSAGR